MALIAYAVLGALALVTLSDFRIRSVTLLILGLFAVQELGAAQRCQCTWTATATRNERVLAES